MDWATGKHQETRETSKIFQVPKPHQVPCVSMLFWDRCLVLQVSLGHVGSMAFPNHQPSNSLIQRIPSSNSMYFQFPFSSHLGHDFIITSYVMIFHYVLFSTSKQINSLRTATQVCWSRWPVMRQSNEDGSTLQRPMIVWGGCCPVKEDCYSTMGLWGSHVFLPLRSGYGTHLTTPLQ